MCRTTSPSEHKVSQYPHLEVEILLANMSLGELVRSQHRCVRFDLSATTVHEVIPFSEIYGGHPRDFVFDRDSRKIPAVFGGFLSLQSWMEMQFSLEKDDQAEKSDTDSGEEDEQIMFSGCVVEDACEAETWKMIGG
mmetsp:Transcript_30132/g.56361  ORF Transcript_30132/g.56361 Transcript_30132/m.56361 type:complete len:137 (+) Transcript_30132:3-413(+)